MNDRPTAAELVEALDKPAPAAAVEVRVFRLKEGDAESVARSLTDALALGVRPGEPRPTVRAEASSNSVVVAASRERLEMAAGLIESMDEVAVEPGGLGVRTIFLEHARAQTLAPIVEQVLTKETIFSVAPEWGRWQLAWNMSNRGQTPDFAGVKVAPEQRLNALIVSAPLPMLELAEELIAGLDVDPGDGPGGERTVRVITLMNAEARELAANIDALFEDADTTVAPPTVRVDSSSNSLIVRASGEQMQLIESLAEHLDKATLATRSHVRMITLDRSRVSASDMAATLKRVLEQRGGVSVEVISADELLAEPDEPAPEEGGGQSQAEPGVVAPVVGALARSLVSLVGVQPVEAGGAEDEPTVRIAVDPATNTLMIIGSDRMTQRIAALADDVMVVPSAADFLQPIVAVKEVAASGEDKEYRRVHVSFQSTGACNISTVNALDTVKLFDHQKSRGRGANKVTWNIEMNEARRLYGVINKRLAGSRYLGGHDYSIADIATFPWLRSWKNQGVELNDYPHLKGWFDEIAARPAVQRGVAVLADQRKPLLGDKAREVLFGATQYKRH